MIERQRENVRATQVQNFSPEFIVGQSRRHDQRNWHGFVRKLVQGNLPVPIRQLSVTHNDTSLQVVQSRAGAVERFRNSKVPLRVAENL
jgi:hypothetical protein